MNIRSYICLPALACFVAFTAQAQTQTKLGSSMLGILQARHIGPAVMGGRITSIDAVANNPRVVYVGTAGGGVWKSQTGGTLFKPVFDKQCQSVGALAIDQQHPDTVWVGTGESNMRNSVSVGDGIYKTVDGGENWVRMGLEGTEHISKIIIHPRNSNVLYVAAPGHLWNDDKERGLYKTTDGGKTWKNILYIDEKTGCADIAMDTKNPEVIYATTWQFRRTPYSFSSGGPGSAVYKSLDAGQSWKKLQNGLPEGEFGRVALALAPSEPNNLFAIVESKKTGLFLSRDGGLSWKQQSSSPNVTARPFYFSTIMADPTNAKRVYRPAFSFSISDDGGESFTQASNAGGWVHSDHHALWINPNNTSHMLLGTDGGVYMSMDKGNNWLFLNNIPVSQFYHVAVDQERPYNVYGGLQDNGSWTAPSQSVNGINGGDWVNVGGGDGFWVQPDLSDRDIVYSESQGGNISRLHRRTNEYVDIQPQPLANEPKLRFNWNTPIVISPTDKTVLYIGAQYLYKTVDKGNTWKRISPDLTTNDPKKQQQEESGGLTVDNSSAENHCTIFTIAESPRDVSTIWVGTDDGNLQVTTNGGGTWTNVSPNIPATVVPTGAWVSSIEPGRYNPATVYATFDNHTYGDMRTYVARSTDMGKTWASLATDDLKGYAHKIREDIVQPGLLFLGTESGLFMSNNDGQSWIQMKAKIPPVAVRDIQIQPQTNDLVLATHGRGVLILDDISPLRQLTPELLNTDAAFLQSRPGAVSNGHFGGAFPSAGGYVGPNTTEEAMILYYLKDRAMTGEVRVDIYNPNGERVASMPGGRRKGINVVRWDMTGKPPRVAEGVRLDGAGFAAPLVPPGTYTVKLVRGDNTTTGTLQLIPDPLLNYSQAERSAKRAAVDRTYAMIEDLAFLTRAVLNQQKAAQTLSASTQNESLKLSLKNYNDTLEGLRKILVATKEGSGITGEERLREKLSGLFYSLIGYDGPPTTSQADRVNGLEVELKSAQATASALFGKELAALNSGLQTSGMTPIPVLTRTEFDRETLNQP